MQQVIRLLQINPKSEYMIKFHIQIPGQVQIPKCKPNRKAEYT